MFVMLELDCGTYKDFPVGNASGDLSPRFWLSVAYFAAKFLMTLFCNGYHLLFLYLIFVVLGPTRSTREKGRS